jgi:hypothetical protein
MDLRDEILRQKRAQEELKKQIENYNVIRQQLTMKRSTELDPRRNVRHLANYMTCKPEMRIT